MRTDHMRAALLLVVALLASISGVFAQTGSSKTPTVLNAEVNSLFPDQVTGGVTPFDARQTLLDIIASYPNLNATVPAGTILCNPISGTAAIQNCTGGQVEHLLLFTQAGTGAFQRFLDAKIKDYWASPEDFGAAHDGTTDDTPAIQRAITAIITAGGGTLFLPGGANCYKTAATLTIDLSAISGRFQGDMAIIGSGPQGSCIQNATSAATVLQYTGSLTHDESYFHIGNVRFTGNGGSPISGSVGLGLNSGAWMTFDRLYVEGFDTGVAATDVDQIAWYNSNIRVNNKGFTINGAVSITSPNSWSFYNTLIAGNATYGLQCTNCNSFSYFGGSIQGNGTTPGNTGQFGVSLIESGTGYGTTLFSGTAFESNSGIADLVSNQTTNQTTLTLESVGFIRVTNFATNNLQVTGSNVNSTYKLTGSTFKSLSPYTPNSGRPTIALANTSAKIIDDGSNYFQNAVETIKYPNGQFVVYGNPIMIGGSVTGVNFNSATTDNSITISSPTPRYFINTVRISQCSGTITTATFGLFSAAAGGGVAITATTTGTVSTAADNTLNNGQSVGAQTATNFTLGTLVFRVIGAEGSAATCNVDVGIVPLI